MHHNPPPPLAYVYLAAIAAGTAAVCWFTRREVGRVRVAVDEGPGPSSSPPVRRAVAAPGGRLLTLVEPMTAEAVERRRLLETHLREQLAAEVAEREQAKYAEGYADGITRRQES